MNRDSRSFDIVFAKLLAECRSVHTEQLGGGGPVAVALSQGGSQHRWFSQLQEPLVKRGFGSLSAVLLCGTLGPLGEISLDLAVS